MHAAERSVVDEPPRQQPDEVAADRQAEAIRVVVHPTEQAGSGLFRTGASRLPRFDPSGEQHADEISKVAARVIQLLGLLVAPRQKRLVKRDGAPRSAVVRSATLASTPARSLMNDEQSRPPMNAPGRSIRSISRSTGSALVVGSRVSVHSLGFTGLRRRSRPARYQLSRSKRCKSKVRRIRLRRRANSSSGPWRPRPTSASRYHPATGTTRGA